MVKYRIVNYINFSVEKAGDYSLSDLTPDSSKVLRRNGRSQFIKLNGHSGQIMR